MSSPEPTRPTSYRWLALSALGVLLALAAVQRLYHWETWPLRFHVMRQYSAALRARDIWLGWKPAASYTPAQARYVDADLHEPWYEPPITELLAATGYSLTGNEAPAIATWFGTAFWLISGVLLYAIAGKLTQHWQARLAAAAYLLLNPFSAIVCRTFQPEPLMVAAFLAALWLLMRRGYPATWGWALVCGLACGIAVLAKPGGMLFPLAGALVGVGLREKTPRQLLTDVKLYVMLALMTVPSVFWIWKVCPQQAGVTFLPSMLLETRFLLRWGRFISDVVNWPIVLAAIAGTALFAQRRDRPLYWCMFGGSMAFLVLTNYRSMTHNYYHVALMPVIALMLIPLADRLITLAQGRSKSPQVTTILITAIIVVAAAATTLISVRKPLEVYQPLTGEEYAQIGKVVGTKKAAVMSDDYARGLVFHASINALHWPSIADRWLAKRAKEDGANLNDQQRLKQMGAQYFVVTSHRRFNAETEVVDWLLQNFAVADAKEGRYLILDLTRPATPAPQPAGATNAP